MVEILLFLIGLIFNVLLCGIFYAQKKERDQIVHFLGLVLLSLAIPILITLILVIVEKKGIRISIFLGIFLLYLLLEGIYDFILKIPFRRNWKLLTPYLVLYYMTNYGMIVINWKIATERGILILMLCLLQIGLNIWNHLKPRKKS